MVATAADTPAALVSRSRASPSWVTNSSCFLASGPTRACEGPVSMAASCRWAEAAMAESWRREVTRSGPAVWGSSSTAWTWVMNVEPHRRDRPRGGAQGPDRAHLPADDRHDGDGREQGGREIGLGGIELRPGRVQQVYGSRGGQLARGQVGLDLLQAGQPPLVMAVGRPGPDGQEGEPDQEHEGDAGDDQPGATPPTDSLAHGNHSLLQASGPRDLGARGRTDRRGGQASPSSMVPEPRRNPWSMTLPVGRRRASAPRGGREPTRWTASIPACRSRPSGWLSVG